MTPDELNELRTMQERYNRLKTGVVLTDQLMALAIFSGLVIARSPIWHVANPIFKRYSHPDDYEGALYTAVIASQSPYPMLEYNTNWNWLIPIVSKLANSDLIEIYDINNAVLKADIEKTFELVSSVVMKKYLGQ